MGTHTAGNHLTVPSSYSSSTKHQTYSKSFLLFCYLTRVFEIKLLKTCETTTATYPRDNIFITFVKTQTQSDKLKF